MRIFPQDNNIPTSSSVQISTDSPAATQIAAAGIHFYLIQMTMAISSQ
ncbi:hypothetical protein MITSMUL_04460 [Mitsuokella multacida DSM 20544]|uniref:Uncharacterized protein n=1 Tax=Mitsuokella multacida DSM 20544 TaxID=500635 RepID=C9KMM4_9FIRM|nr:hypothetical protein MITSMUL_04460 [Mitsuokella multacida DSM 20544]